MLLNNRYLLQDNADHGLIANIYRGIDIHTDSVIIAKILREEYSTDPKFVTRFQREAKATASLQHPNIVHVYDYGQYDGKYFIVMEFIEGTNLRRYMRSRGILDNENAIKIAYSVALGLGTAHSQGIVYRNVRPLKILLSRDGSIKLTALSITQISNSPNMIGMVEYYSPEQAQGGIVTPASDIYSLGCCMYEMLTGHIPFDGATHEDIIIQHTHDTPLPPSQLNPNIPTALEEIIMRCLEKVPDMRYSNGTQLAQALEALPY